MLQSKIHKSFSIQSYNSYKETSSSIKDSIINDAFSRFYTLNNSYSIQTQTHPIFHEREKKDQFSPTRKNGRVDGFTIMAQLRHLQNVAELSKVDHQKEKRNRILKKQSQQARQKNKWKRAENTLNQPYLETYSKWLKQRQNQNDEQNMILDGESEQQKSLHNSKQSETQLIFKKELKPYKKIVEFTKRKLKMKQQSQKQSCEADKKTHSVDHIKSHTYKSYYKEYTEIARKLQWKQEKDKMKSQGEPNLEQIVDKQMIRIFKKAPKSFKINQKDSKLQQTFNSLKRKSVSASAPHRPSILLNDKSEEDRDEKIRGIMRKSKNMSGRRLTKSVSMNEKTNFDILK